MPWLESGRTATTSARLTSMSAGFGVTTGFGAWRALIVDSDVLIDALRGNARTIEWLHTQRRNHRELRYSVVSRAELMAGPRPQELALITTFLATMEPVVI